MRCLGYLYRPYIYLSPHPHVVTAFPLLGVAKLCAARVRVWSKGEVGEGEGKGQGTLAESDRDGRLRGREKAHK